MNYVTRREDPVSGNLSSNVEISSRTIRRWKRKRARRQRLETVFEDLQREISCSLDELEYALESGDVE